MIWGGVKGSVRYLGGVKWKGGRKREERELDGSREDVKVMKTL